MYVYEHTSYESSRVAKFFELELTYVLRNLKLMNEKSLQDLRASSHV